MGEGAVQGKTQSPSQVVIDFNGDGIVDHVGLRWVENSNWIGISSVRPVVTSAKLGQKEGGDPVSLKKVQSLQACGTEYKVGKLFPDTAESKSPITRRLTEFFVKIRKKKEKDPASGNMGYSLRLYMQLAPEVPDDTHRRSSRTICGPFFDRTFSIEDSDNNNFPIGLAQ